LLPKRAEEAVKSGIEKTVGGALSLVEQAKENPQVQAGWERFKQAVEGGTLGNIPKYVLSGLDAFQDYKDSLPDVQKQALEDDLTNIGLGILTVGTAGIAGGGVKAAARTGIREGVEQVAETGARAAVREADDLARVAGREAVETAAETEPRQTLRQTLNIADDVDPAVALREVRDNLEEQVYGRQSLARRVENANTEILDTLTSNPRYIPEIDAANASFDTAVAFKNISDDLADMGQTTRNLLNKVDELDGGVSTETVIRNTVERLRQLATSPDFDYNGRDIFKDALQRLKSVYDANPNVIPRARLWDIRQSVDKSINQLTDTNLQKSIRQEVRRSFANELENIPQDTQRLIPRVMGEMQKLIEARDFVDPKIAGGLANAKIKGGQLGNIIMRSASAQVGAIAGATTGLLGGPVGSIVGAIAGHWTADKLGKYLAEKTLMNASQRRVLEKFVAERPSVLKDIEAYMKNPKAGNQKLLQTVEQMPKDAQKLLPDPKDFKSKKEYEKYKGRLDGFTTGQVASALGIASLLGALVYGGKDGTENEGVSRAEVDETMKNAEESGTVERVPNNEPIMNP